MLTPLPVTYDYDKLGNIALPEGQPFDGQPVLIKLAAGWCEAWWSPSERHETQDGVEYDGFCWVCVDDKFQAELDDAEFWLPVPVTPPRLCGECGKNPVDVRGICAGCDAYREHTGAI